MKILLTGSEGNIGGQLKKHLKQKGYRVFCSDLKQIFKDDYTVADITNTTEMVDVFKWFKPDVVFHLAAMVSRIVCERSPAMTIKTNVWGTYNIARLCKVYNAKLINFSTSEIYGNIGGLLSENRKDINPNNIYGLSKWLAEGLVNYETQNGLRAINVRPFMIYGEHEVPGENKSALVRFAASLKSGQPVTVHRGAMRSWLHVSDFVNILERLIYVTENTTVNICSDEYKSIEKLAFLMCEILSIDPNKHIKYRKLPSKMTLTKKPDSSRLKKLTNDYKYNIDLQTGLKKMLC